MFSLLTIMLRFKYARLVGSVATWRIFLLFYYIVLSINDYWYHQINVQLTNII